MPDNSTLPATGEAMRTKLLASDSSKIQTVELAFVGGSVGAHTETPVPGDATNGMDVDVTRVPADPFGANADAVVAAGAVGSIQAKLRRLTQGVEDLKTQTVLATGTNVVGGVYLFDAGGINAAAIDGSGRFGVTLGAALPAGTNLIGKVALARSSDGLEANFTNFAGDGLTTGFAGFTTPVFLHGFNGTTWDRLRVTANGLVADVQGTVGDVTDAPLAYTVNYRLKELGKKLDAQRAAAATEQTLLKLLAAAGPKPRPAGGGTLLHRS